MTFQQSSSVYFQTSKVFISIVLIFLASLYLLSSILVPIIISFSLYALLSPVTAWLVRKNIHHSLAIVISLLIMIFTSFLALLYALPKLFEQLFKIQQKFPTIISIIERYADLTASNIFELTGVELDVPDLILSILSQSTSVGNAFLVQISNQISGIGIAILLIPFITYFLLKDFKGFRNSLLHWLPNSSFELGWIIYHRVAQQLESYTRGVLIQSMIMACVTSLGFFVVGLELPVLMGIVTGLLNLIPYIGPLISIVFSLLIALGMTPFEPSLLYLVVMVIVAAQVFDNVIVIPYVIANAVNLHPVMVILGVIIFGNIFGMVGVILAIPAIAAAKILFSNLYSNIDNSKHRMSLR